VYIPKYSSERKSFGTNALEKNMERGQIYETEENGRKK
jgi:hypothetical protein